MKYNFAVFVALISTSFTSAQQPPGYAKQVKPFLAKYCLECHSSDKPKGGLDMTAYKTLLQGGDNGPVFVPGKPEGSRIVQMVEGKDKNVMPPKKAKQPSNEERAVLRNWIAAGAKDDSTSVKITLPAIKPRLAPAAPVAAVAYHPNGKILAAAGNQEVRLIEVTKGELVGSLTGQTGLVTALAFSRDGKYLAAASGSTGSVGEVRFYNVPASGLPDSKPLLLLAGHRDLILDLAWSPDSKTLASSGYDRLIKLWEVPSGKELHSLKDHSDSVYALGFSTNGQLLASAAADRAVKVWDVSSGTRLYTLGEATDWLYALAWSPQGNQLAAAGVDKSIRAWEANADGGKLIHSVFAHDGSITRLVYAPDGKTLYSVSEDKTFKAWDASKMIERKLYAAQPDTPLAIGVRPDQKQLALGRYDGALILLDEASGQVQSQPLPAKPMPPLLSKMTPAFSVRGSKVRIQFEGKYLDSVTDVVASHQDVKAKILAAGRTSTALAAELTFPASVPVGIYSLSLKNAIGTSAMLPFTLDWFALKPENEGNDAPSTGQMIVLPVSIAGSLARDGDIDHYQFVAKAGQQVGVHALIAGTGSKLEPVLQVIDEAGRILGENDNGVVGFTCAKAGRYRVSIHDKNYRGGKEMQYRLHIGDIPVVNSVFPLGVQRGQETDIALDGVHLGVESAHLKVPSDAKPGSSIPLSIQTSRGSPLGRTTLTVGEFPEASPNRSTMAVPGTANGRIEAPGKVDTWRFVAKKGQKLILEVNARRLGTPLDSYLEVLDAKGQPVPRATLRGISKIFTTFRDHDSVVPGIRIETWNDLAMNDFLLVGNELVRIFNLPKNPDDDCQFYSVAGQRVGYLDTTPTHHSNGTPMYKVSIHPPGTTFPPNGLPVVTLNYRNDDGGPGYGKDSRIVFDPPTDGDYQVRIGDSCGQGGKNYAYRLTIRPPQPSFTVSFTPTSPSVWKGGAIPITVTATRADGFEGRIDVRLDNVPPGFSAPPTSIPEGENSTAFALWAEPTAANPGGGAPLKVTARASIDGHEIVREAMGQMPQAVDAGDIVATTEQSEVTVQPGKEVRLTVNIDRRNGFKGRVPVEVRGLPHGVRVLDIGLNGILITPMESSRTFVIYAEPWVKATEHPFVVLARREGKNTEHAARSVMLKVK